MQATNRGQETGSKAQTGPIGLMTISPSYVFGGCQTLTSLMSRAFSPKSSIVIRKS
jgi:hypothetical protein